MLIQLRSFSDKPAVLLPSLSKSVQLSPNLKSCPRPSWTSGVANQKPQMAHRIPTIQRSITRYKKKLEDIHLPEVTRLLGINLVNADRAQLHADLSLIKNHLQNVRTQIGEALEKWDAEISQSEDKAIRGERSDAFLLYRVNGTEVSPGNVDELVENTEEQILDIDQRIDQIMNGTPCFVAPRLEVPAVFQRNPVPAPSVPVQAPVQFPHAIDQSRDSRLEPSVQVSQKSTSDPFHESFTNKSERRTRESFSCTGIIPIINLKIPNKNPESFSFFSPGRVLSEKVKKEKRNSPHSIRICVVNPVRWKGSRFKNPKIHQKSWTPSSRHQKSKRRFPRHLKSWLYFLRHRKSWTRSSKHRKSGSRSPIQRMSIKNPKTPWKSWSQSFRQSNSSSISEIPRPHGTTKLKKENLDPGILTQNGHTSLSAPECRGSCHSTRKKT